MKQEELSLLKELFNLEELHREYQDNDTQYVIDTKKEGNTVTIKVTFKENKDKKEFENWVNELDDELFDEVWESLSKQYGLKDLNSIYESTNYKNVITLFKNRTKEIVAEKIKQLQKLL